MIKRIISIITLTILICCTVPVQQVSAASNYINAFGSTVHDYQKQPQSFTLTKNSRFFIVSAAEPDAQMLATVNLVASEFAMKKKPSKKKLPVVYGPEKDSKKGDILIKTVTGYQPEGYRINVGKDGKVIISAGTDDGLFYGLRTLLQYRISAASNKLPGCIIKDRPDVAERTVHLDCGRKYFSKVWIQNIIKKMSWQKYNAIEIHFSEDQGLRLFSKKFPWLAGSYNGDNRYLTQKEMAAICATARKYHVEVIPSFDSPGHTEYMLKRYRNYIEKHPEYKFTYKGKTYSAKYSGFKNISNYYKYNGDKSGYNYQSIDLANPVARAFTSALIDEYAAFFKEQGCTKFNIGGDELLGWSNVTVGGRTFTYYTKWYALQHWDDYAKKKLHIKNGSATDTLISYLNTTANRLEKSGYTCRVWSDEIDRMKTQHINLNKDIHIVYWSNKYQPISKLKKKGYKFHNAVSLWTYYVTTPGGGYKNSTAEKIFKGWNPKSFADPGKLPKKVKASQYAGAYFCIWCDYPYRRTPQQVWEITSNRMWSSSAKMWNAQINTRNSGNGKALKYNQFRDYIRQLGGFPGYSGTSTKASR